MIGRTLAHYLIEERLGAGGMGEVYRARDLALDRTVALKVLPAGVGPELQARLLREAQASARLQHPGIATFYEAGDADGRAFIVMEYVSGRTLRQTLAAGPLPPEQAIALACGVLEALAHAHAAGILHRDIKPENIMVTAGGAAKLLDFGVAKHLLVEGGGADHAETATALTGAGMIVGTVGYMSPEQLRGDAVDVRADVFSAGAVLYEAVGGRPAFPGATPTERLAAILSKDPVPLSGPGLPPQLWTVVSHALARDPAHRYPTTRSFLSELHRVTAGEIVAALPDTLAILDLENLSGDPSDNWMGSGIAESLAADLGHAEGLSVVPREKVLKARAAVAAPDGMVDALDLGLRLGCRWVLSGSYQRVGPALRVTARLAEVSTSRVVATEKIDSTVERIFDLQDRLAAACLGALSLTVPTRPPTPSAAPTLTAYEAYARGRRLWFRMEKGSFDEARELYEQAVEAEPSHAPALAGLAAVHALRFTFTTDRRDLEASEGYARRAIAADPTSGEPHIWLGYVLMRLGRLAEAYAEEQTVMRLSPENYFGAYFAGCALLAMSRPLEALPFYQRAIEIDAQAGFNWLGLGWTHAWLGRLAEARWSLAKAIETERTKAPGTTAGAAGYLAECLRRQGDLVGARRECLAGIDAAERSDHMYRDTFRGFGLCVLGRTALDQGDRPAAQAAFAQAVALVRGRPRSLGGGHLLVQALAGLARAERQIEPFHEARRLVEERREHDFSWFYGCSDDVTLSDLARAADELANTEEARVYCERARHAGAASGLLPETP